MKKSTLAAVFLCLFIRTVTLDAETPPKAPDLGSESTENLISQFQQVSEQTIGLDSLATAQGFVALDATLTFGGGILGTPRPPVLPTLRELVRRGLGAVPALLDHLSDARPTKLTAGSDDKFSFTAAWYADEYHPRDLAKPPVGVNTVDAGGKVEPEYFEHHQVKVGDLCFVTLGQIVNRGLDAVRYQPSSCLVVNSPVKTPALAAAARADWNGLTAGDFKDFLIKDAGDPSPYASPTGALQRLLFYYPDDGQALAIRWLGLPLFNVAPVEGFIMGPLRSADDEQQDRLLAAFRAEYGGVYYQGAVQALILTADKFTREEKLFPVQSRKYAYAAKLVKRRFADVDKHPPPCWKATYCGDQQRLVEALAAFPSTEIDQAIYDLLKRTLVLQPSDRTDQYNQCQLASICARRLAVPARSEEITRAAEQLRSEMLTEKVDAKVTEAYNRHYQSFLQDVAKVLPPEQKTP